MRAELGLALRLARRELRGGLRGFRVFLACLSLGVASIAAVGSVSQAMLAGLRDDGRILLGGDLDLRLVHREATPEQRDFLSARAEVSEVAELRTMARAAAGDGRPALIALRAVDEGYPLYGAVELSPTQPIAEALARRDGVWGAVVEAPLLRRLDLELGARLRIGAIEYELRAVLEREPDRTARIGAFGPHVLVAHASLAESGLVQPGSLVRYHYGLRLPAGAEVAELREAIADAYPEAGWRIRDSSAAAPGTSRFIERLGLFLTLVGLTALLVGGLGVGNAVRAYLGGRRRTIATLKCLGAPGRLIFLVYLLQVAALASVGTGIGLLAGAAAPYLLGGLLGEQLGWSVAGRLYPLALATAAAFGLLTALAFSLWPLARARRIAPGALFRSTIEPPAGIRPGRLALAAILLCGVALAGLAVASAADRWLALWFALGAAGSLLAFLLVSEAVLRGARRLPRPRHPGLRLALANLHRPGSPTASVVTSLGLGMTVLVAVVLVEGNLARALRETLPEQAPAFYFIDIQPDQVADFERIVAETPGARGLERVPMLRGRIVSVNGRGPDELELPPEIAWVFRGDRGLTWTRNPPPRAELVAGDWWPPDYAGPPLVSLDAEVGEALAIGPGDRLGINVLGRDLAVEIANLRTVDWSDLGINFVMIFSPGLLESAPQTHIATVQAEPAAEDALERAVTDRFANVSAIRVREVLEAIVGLLGRVAAGLRAGAAVVLATGLLVLAGAVAADHRRRVYDAVVLKVLGATRRDVALSFVLEFGLLGLLTGVLAVALGAVAAYFVLAEVMDMPFVFLPGMAFGTAFLAAVVALGLGFLGTWRALGQPAAPLLRNA